MDFGLRQRDLETIVSALMRFPEIEEALLFGSRAKGTFKKGSDVDISVKGDTITHQVVASLSHLLNEESTLPYYFDIVHFDALSEQALREHIQRVGQRIYPR